MVKSAAAKPNGLKIADPIVASILSTLKRPATAAHIELYSDEM